MNFRRSVRVALAHGLYFTGLLSLFASIRLRRKAVVLMYHRVLTDEEYSRNFCMGGIAVKTRTFEKQMKFLKENFRILSPEEFLPRLQGRIPFETKCCLVTFDDGWKDNFINAFPILKENKIPGLIFLSTGFIGSNRRFWQEHLIATLSALRLEKCDPSKKLDKRCSEGEKERIRKILGCDENAFREEISLFVASQKKKKITQIEEMITLLDQGLDPSDGKEAEETVFLNWQEIGMMDKGGVRFGSHGVSHQILPLLETKEIEKEVSESEAVIESRLGNKIWAFSYPNGDYNEKVLSAVNNHGYKIAFGTEPGPIASGDNPFMLRRRNIHEDMTDSIPMFLARIAGLW